jgi:hypothetical protein
VSLRASIIVYLNVWMFRLKLCIQAPLHVSQSLLGNVNEKVSEEFLAPPRSTHGFILITKGTPTVL